MLGGWSLLKTHSERCMPNCCIGLGAAYVLVVVALTVWMRRSLRKIAPTGDRPRAVQCRLLAPLFEYRSKLTLFGLPLVHIRLRGGLERGPVKAWIAGGDSAIGVIFAFGAVAIAPDQLRRLRCRSFDAGRFCDWSGVFGRVQLGSWAIGGMAVGWQAFGGCAIAWLAAHGGVASPTILPWAASRWGDMRMMPLLRHSSATAISFRTL